MCADPKQLTMTVCVCVFLNQCAAERSHGSYGQIASSVPGESVQVVTMHS